MFLQLLVIALSIWALHYRWKRREIYKVYNQLPKISLNSYPVVGHAHLFGSSNKDRMDFFIYLGKKAVEFGGLTTFWIGNKLYLTVCDPDTAEAVLRCCLDKDDSTMKYMRALSGNGSIFAPVKIWRPRRKVLAPVFSTKNLRGFGSEFAKQATIMTNLLEQEVGKDEVLMWNFVNTYTFDGICKNSMGIDINSQTNKYHDFLKAFEELLRLVALRMLSPLLQWDAVYELMQQAKDFTYWRQLAYDFIDNQIKLKREELAAPESKNEIAKNNTFLSMMIEGSSGGEKGYTDLELREEISVILGAGSDTSAVGTCFTAVVLSRYPEIQEKVYQELQDVFGNTDRPVTVDDLPKLVYLEAVVKETMRVYPPVPVYVREIFEDFKLPNGVTLSKGVAVMINVYGMHRNHKYWGDDVETFRPERFLEGPLRHPVQFIPFSYSVRNCLGATYALMSMKTAMATMLRRFRLLPPAGLDPQRIKEPLKLGFDIMTRHIDNYAVRLEYRNK